MMQNTPRLNHKKPACRQGCAYTMRKRMGALLRALYSLVQHSSELRSHQESRKYCSPFPTVASLLFFLIACDATVAYGSDLLNGALT